MSWIRSAPVAAANSAPPSAAIKTPLYIKRDKQLLVAPRFVRIASKSDARIKELLDAFELIKQEFEFIERSTFEINTPLISVETPSKVKASRIPFLSPRQPPQDKPEPLGRKSSDAEEQLSKLKLESELEDHGSDNSMDGICEWEFEDKIEKEPRKSVQESSKI